MSALTTLEYAYVNGECGPEERAGYRLTPRDEGRTVTKLSAPRLPAYINGEILPEELEAMRRGR